MNKIKPNYYKTGGKDLLDDFYSSVMRKDQLIGFCLGNVIKYLTRFNDKNGIEDLKKAEEYTLRLSSFSIIENSLSKKALRKNLDKATELTKKQIVELWNGCDNKQKLAKRIVNECLKTIRNALIEKAFDKKQILYLSVVKIQINTVIKILEGEI